LVAGLTVQSSLASGKGLSAVEYSFAPFSSGKAAKELDAKEKKSLRAAATLAQEKGVQFDCLNLDFCHNPEDKKSSKLFLAMMTKTGSGSRSSFMLESRFQCRSR